MARKYVAITAVVSGEGRFPVDMLRYDHCLPQSQTDVTIAFTRTDHRQVTVLAFSATDCKPGLTGDRWRSFGWTVQEVSKPLA